MTGLFVYVSHAYAVSMSLYIDIVIETYKLSNIRHLFCSFFIHSTSFSCGNQAIFHEFYLRTKKYGWAPCWIRWLCVSAMTKPKLLPAASEYVWNFKNVSESSKKKHLQNAIFHNWTGPKMVIVRALLRANLIQASCATQGAFLLAIPVGLVALQHLKLAREAPRRVIAAVCPVIAQVQEIQPCDRSYMQHVMYELCVVFFTYCTNINKSVKCAQKPWHHHTLPSITCRSICKVRWKCLMVHSLA